MTGIATVRAFQSPFHRVKECNFEKPVATATGIRMWASVNFQSPFHRVKECNAAYERPISANGAGCFQSPFHRVKECNHPMQVPVDFQSPFHRVKECNRPCNDVGIGIAVGVWWGCGYNWNFQSPFHRVKECNRPRAALINPSRMSRVSVFFDTFCVSSHQTSPRSSKKCTSPAHLVFMPIHGAVITDFANRLLVLPGVRSLVAIRENRSQIHPPPPVSKAQCRANTRLAPTKEVSLLLHQTATENA